MLTQRLQREKLPAESWRHLGQWIGYTPHYHKITSMDSQINASDISEVSIDSISGDGSMLVNEICPPQIMLEDIEQHDARI
jgi:hypothetical protein